MLRSAKEAEVGSRKGEKAALMREMAERGEFAPKLPARVGRKPPVTPTVELLREACDRFSKGETLRSICLDDRMPDRTNLWRFTLTNPEFEEMWATAKALHAELLMEQTGPIADREVIGPDGRHDAGAVQRDRLRIEQRHMRAASLDPARWGKQSTQVIVGDADRPVVTKTTLSPLEVTLGIRALLLANERSMGLLVDETRTDQERLAAVVSSGKPMTPALYEALNPEDEP
jgi:hypothetical protein